MINPNEMKVNRAAISITSLKETDEKLFWQIKSPVERLLELELNRKMVFGYDSPPRLQRLLEVIKPT